MGGGMLASEAGATLLGLGKMRRAGATGRQILTGLKSSLPAFGTYALPVVAGTGAAHASQGAVLKGRRLLRGDEEEEKTGMIPSAGQGLKAAQKSMQPAPQRLVKSQNIGVPSFKMPEPKPLNKIGFAQSAYSGPLSDGNSTKYESYIPPFRNPPVKTAGPPSEDKGKTAAMLDELCKLNNVISVQGQLTKTKKVGAPKASAPPGPSIQQVAKPVGFGTPIAGATKGSI
jgi:hypothetical protein